MSRFLPGLLALLTLLALSPQARAAGLLEGNHPRVQQGTDAFAKGDFQAALDHYEAARKELRDSPELLYNLGNAYLKLGRTEEARRAYEGALAGASDSLKPRDYFNLGNALAGMDLKQDAIAAYRQALKLDPHHQPARHNLEVLLRNKQQKNKNTTPSPGDGGTDGGQDAGQDGGRPTDGGRDGGQSDAETPDGGGSDDGGSDGGGSDGGTSDGGRSDGGADGGGDGGSGDGGSDGGADGGGESEQESQGDGGTPDAGSRDGGSAAPPQQPEKPKPVDRQEAERLLDAMRRNEKQFLMQQKQKGKQRVHPEKDW